MATLPPSPDLSVLKTLAKTLLREARAGEAAALRRFADTFSAARDRSFTDLARRDLKLHDAQSVIAREFGFASWATMKRRVEGLRADRRERQATWIRWVYDGDARERPWLHHAVLRGRSLEHIRVLIEAGADPRATNDEGVSLCRWALQHGRTDVADFLLGLGIEEAPTMEERFIAACVGGDAATARAILEEDPGLVSRLSATQLEALPKRAALGDLNAVGTMLAMGWPREMKTEWDATALNLAIFRGDAAMVQLLLEGGADWRTTHAFGDDAIGTLSFASRSDDIDPKAPRDYLGCARALVTHGVPRQELRRGSYSVEVKAYVESLAPAT